MKELLKVMRALGDGTRVKIFKLLQHRALCVCELTSLLGLSQSAVSKHLKLLEDAELVSVERQGPWSNYRLATEANPYAAAIASHFKGWLNEDPKTRDLVARAERADRAVLCQRKGAGKARGAARQAKVVKRPRGTGRAAR